RTRATLPLSPSIHSCVSTPVFFLNDTSPTEIYTLSLHDALPIFDEVELPSPMPDDELLALDEALDRLATVDTRAAEMVKLCFFVGLTQEEAARELGGSLSTGERGWGFARAWLLREVRKQTTGTSQ